MSRLALALLAGVGACSPRLRPSVPDEPIWLGAAASPCNVALERVAAVDEPTELGFSAVEALQSLGGPRTSPLVWLPPPRSEEYAFEFGPERASSTLSVSVTLAPGEIGLRRAAPSSDDSVDAECGEDVLLIPVDVTLQSAGSALDESFRGVLEASSPHRGRLTARFERGALAGGLIFSKPDSFDPARSFHVGAALLELLVWQGGSHGTLSVEVGAASSGKDGAVAAQPLEARPSVAVWPSAAQCPEGWAALPSNSTLSGASATDVIAALGAQPSEELRWSDGSESKLRLSFQALPDELCQSTGDVLEFDAALGAKSSDGRVDSVLPVRVLAAGDEIEITRSESIDESSSPAARANGAELSSYVDVEARYRRGGASGSLEVRATVDVSHEATVLASGQWSR